MNGEPQHPSTHKAGADSHEQSTRREMLTRLVRRTAYAVPVVCTLGMAQEAMANSKDGIRWSLCASFGDPCGAMACCAGYQCVAEPGNPHCVPG